MPRARITRSIHVAAEPQDVYDFALHDLSSLADWMTSVEAVTGADPSWPAVGSSYTFAMTVGGKGIVGRSTVLEVEPPRRVVTREEVIVGPDGATSPRSGRSTWLLEPEGTGTRFTIELVGANLSLPLYLLWRLLFSGQTAGRTVRSLANLKRICEEELEDVPAEG